MPRKKQTEQWVEVQEAARVMSENNGRTVSADYIRLLGHNGKIAMQKKDGRTNLYLLSDVEAYRVRANHKGGQGKRQSGQGEQEGTQA